MFGKILLIYKFYEIDKNVMKICRQFKYNNKMINMKTAWLCMIETIR